MAAALPLLYLMGVRGFNASGQLTVILSINASSGAVEESPVFVVRSPFDSCGAAFDAGDGTGARPPRYYVPDGSPMEPAPLYEFLTVSVRGEVTHRAKATGGTPPGGSWDWPFVAFDARSQLGYGIGSLRPPPGPQGNTRCGLARKGACAWCWRWRFRCVRCRGARRAARAASERALRLSSAKIGCAL